jgi:hypothetical protein
MPLIKSGSKKAFQHNVEVEMKAHPGERAKNLAIAYSIKRKNAHKKHMAHGGEVSAEDRAREHDHIQQGNREAHNEKLMPHQRSMLNAADRRARAIAAISRHEQEHDHLGEARAAEPMERVHLDEENMGRNVGVTHPADRRAKYQEQDHDEPDHHTATNNHMHHTAQQLAHGGEAKLGSGKRFEKLEHSLAHKHGVHDPAALAAAIGRKKFGADKMSKLAHHEHLAHGGMAGEDDADQDLDSPMDLGDSPMDLGDSPMDLGDHHMNSDREPDDILSHDSNLDRPSLDRGSNEEDGVELPEEDNKKQTLARILADVRARHMKR